MSIKMVDLQAEYAVLKNEIDEATSSVLQSGYFVNGPEVGEFAKNCARYLNVKQVVPCGNGTDALQIAMMALNLQPGDEVIIPAFTYVAPAECAALLKLKPVFVDVDNESFNIDCTQIEAAITPKTKAIVVVHLFGQTADMNKINTIAHQHNLFVIEDVAQAFGAQLNGKYAGTLSTIGCTSFFPSKNLGCYGDGGALYSNNIEVMKSAKHIASHGQSGQKFYHDFVGVNSRLDAIQAAILNVKLPLLPNYLQTRKSIAKRYIDELSSIDSITLPKTIEGMDHTYHQFVIQVDAKDRDGLRNHLAENGIQTGVYYPHTIPSLPPYKDGEQYPVADELTKRIIALPIHPYLKQNDQEKVSLKIKQFFNHG